jgi:hsp70-interacting protein
MSGGGGDPFAWLGLLKWSLSYSDGTSEGTQRQPMSAEDREFLETVMREGIVDESERMKEILRQVAQAVEEWKEDSEPAGGEQAGQGDDHGKKERQEREVSGLLDELRDIVENVDYARALCALKGLPFLIGCARERGRVPRSVRARCLSALAAAAQNNPPVQRGLLELGALGALSDLYFCEDRHSADDDADGEVRARILQALSAAVRGHELAEQVFGGLDQAPAVLGAGLGLAGPSPSAADAAAAVPPAVRRRALFLLRALVASDYADPGLADRFAVPIAGVAARAALGRDGGGGDGANEGGDSRAAAASAELEEMGLSLLVQVLEQKRGAGAVLPLKDALAGAGVERISALRRLEGEEREDAARELELWERLLRLLAEAAPAPDGSATPQ